MDKKVVFESSKRNKLSGILSLPHKDFKGLIVIFAHGLGSNKESDKYQDAGKLLLGKNIGVFLFDFFGHGESEGQFEDLTIDEGADDILSAIKTVKDLGFSKIGLIGTSFGGISSIIAASKTVDLKFLGLVAPVSIPEELPPSSDPERARLKKSFESDRFNNGHKIASKINIPVFIIHGSEDEVVPLEHSQRFCQLLTSCHLEVINGGNHRLRNPKHYQEVLRLITKLTLENSI